MIKQDQTLSHRISLLYKSKTSFKSFIYTFLILFEPFEPFDRFLVVRGESFFFEKKEKPVRAFLV
jgi:hypothetical protein